MVVTKIDMEKRSGWLETLDQRCVAITQRVAFIGVLAIGLASLTGSRARCLPAQGHTVPTHRVVQPEYPVPVGRTLMTCGRRGRPTTSRGHRSLE